MRERSSSKRIEILEEKPESVIGPVGKKARYLFLETKKCWKELGLTKNLPRRKIHHTCC